MLAACGGAATEDAAQSAQPVTVTVTTTVEPTTKTTQTSAETQTSSEGHAADASTAPVEDPVEKSDPPEPKEDVEDRDFGDGSRSERGNLIKEVGQWAGIAGDTDDLSVVFRVADIERDFTCTSDWAEAPQNGEYVALTIEVETFPGLADNEWFNDFGITHGDITVFDEDGVRENDSEGNAWMCLDQRDELPYGIGPAQKASGQIVIDTSVRSGSIMISNYLIDGGWEWEF